MAMSKEVRRVYKEAMSNQEFDRDMRTQDPIGYAKPNFFSKEIFKIAYAAAYYGWLLGKGRYKRENYDY